MTIHFSIGFMILLALEFILQKCLQTPSPRMEKKRDIERSMRVAAKNTLHGTMYYMNFADFLLKNAPERTDLINAYSKYIKPKTRRLRS